MDAQVEWLDGAPAANIPSLPLTGSYSSLASHIGQVVSKTWGDHNARFRGNVKGGPDGVSLGGVTMQEFKPERGDDLFTTTLWPILAL